MITQASTFIATILAVAQVGASIVLVDCEPDTALMDVSKLEAAITDKTKAIMPVHLYGQACDMDAINEIAEKRGLVVIEDAAQAAGTTYKVCVTCSCGGAVSRAHVANRRTGTPHSHVTR